MNKRRRSDNLVLSTERRSPSAKSIAPNSTPGTQHPALSILLFTLFTVFTSSVEAAFEESLGSARAIAMGEAFTAIADDAAGAQANPAGLGWIEHQEIASGYSRFHLGLWDGSSLASGYLSYAQPVHVLKRHRGTLGISWNTFSLVQFYTEDTISLAYGKELMPRMLPRFYWGAGIKSLRQTYKLDADPLTGLNPYFRDHGTRSWALGLDLGILRREKSGWSWGYKLANANEPNVALSGSDLLARSHHWGAAVHAPGTNLGLEYVRKGRYKSLHAGAERWLFSGRAAARAGFIYGNRDRRQVSFGLGLRTLTFSLDYAFILAVTGLESTDGTHRFSMSVPFGDRPKKSLAAVPDESAEASAEEIVWMRREIERARTLLKERKAEIRRLTGKVEKLEERADLSGITATEKTAAGETILSSSATAELSPISGEFSIVSPKKKQPDLLEPELADLEDQLKDIHLLLEKSQEAAKSQETRARALERAIERVQAPAPPPPAPKTAPPKNQIRVHRVKPGETLRSIAEAYYGDPMKWPVILKSNEQWLGRGGAVSPGQTLVIPPIPKREAGGGNEEEKGNKEEENAGESNP